jgi:opacity protein-like surface antigen
MSAENVWEAGYMLKKCVLMAALVAVLAPASARADWLFTPNIGSTFGGAAEGREQLTYGASIGWMGAGIVGFEADLQYTPEFFEARDGDLDLIDNSNVLTFMGNAIVGVPVGGQTGAGIRPFGIVGVGLLTRRQDNADEVFNIDSNEFGFNVGGGVIGFLTDHVGLRGDVRYVRSFEDFDDETDGVNVGVGDFDFWRGNFGVTFRW